MDPLQLSRAEAVCVLRHLRHERDRLLRELIHIGNQYALSNFDEGIRRKHLEISDAIALLGAVSARLWVLIAKA